MKNLFKTRSKIVIAITTIIVGCILGGWFYLVNPASPLSQGEVVGGGLYSNGPYTLWRIGYEPGYFNNVNDKLDFEYNASFNDETLDKIKLALQSSSRSHYLLHKPNFGQKLYALNLPISSEEGFTFQIDNSKNLDKGIFIGYKYEGKSNLKVRWFLYKNPELGRVLRELFNSN